MKSTKQYIVDEESAAPVWQGVERMGIERDHSHMCKFEDENAPGFAVVAEAIQRYARDAPNTIVLRWEGERHVREVEKRAAAREILGLFPSPPDTSPHSRPSIPSARPSGPPSVTESSPQLAIESPSLADSKHSSAGTDLQSSTTNILVAPLGFRPNSIFVGFTIERALLEHKLASPRRAEIGSCSVLLWGPPGSGKSHLAREYVWRNRVAYPGGIFWIDCKTTESITKCFWNISQGLGRGDFETDELLFVDSVRKDLESRGDWLMVFDGLAFASEDDIQGFMRYLPDSKGGKIIYTSVDKTLANRQRLFDPTGIKIYPLSPDDACQLLFKSLHLRGRLSARKVEKARQLVKHYAFLPLGIHAAAHMLLTRDRSLEKWSPGPSDQRLASPFLDIVSALREAGHSEAVTLLRLMSFLNHEVPVALLQFGRPALLGARLEIRSADRQRGSSKHELDNTIAILIRSGFVERTLQMSENSSEAGRSSPEEVRLPQRTNSTKMQSVVEHEDSNLQENLLVDNDSARSAATSSGIDVIRLHTVVQNVLLEDLRTQMDEFYTWLTIAARFLCHSFQVATKKMSGKGLAKDYREYESHAARVWSHFPRVPPTDSESLRAARHELHEVLRMLRREIQNSSPSHSSDSSGRRVFCSVFEKSGSSSEDGPSTPGSGLTRESTWDLDPHGVSTESPVEEFQLKNVTNPLIDSWHEDDKGYMSDYEEKVPRTGRTHSKSVSQQDKARQAALHAIFQGDSNPDKRLGSWRPVPSIGAVVPAETLAHSRTSSSSSLPGPRPLSSNSQAEAALSAVHKISPPPAHRERMISPNRRQADRQPLAEVSSNFEPESKDRRTARQPPSPRLAQSVLTNQAAQAWKALPIEENISITRAPRAANSQTNQQWRNVPFVEHMAHPSGYSSAPMSRDTSKESNLEPPAQVAMSVSPVESYLTEQRMASVRMENQDPGLQISQIPNPTRSLPTSPANIVSDTSGREGLGIMIKDEEHEA